MTVENTARRVGDRVVVVVAIDQDRVDLIDYGTGDNGYKTDWMERRIPLIRIDAFNPRRPSNWLPAARTAISALVG